MSYYYRLGLGFDQVWSKKQMADKFTWIIPKLKLNMVGLHGPLNAP
jgi:hypothetical protein